MVDKAVNTPVHVFLATEVLGNMLCDTVLPLTSSFCDQCGFDRTQVFYTSACALALNIRGMIQAAREIGGVPPEEHALVVETIINIILERKASNS